ncbi:peroxisome assembly protein (Peroxin-2) [Ascosphaera acerosa]|nr:peroxisome assembly protein (Peroxin-2) [Ascosphaera acerosa]
MTRTPTSSFAAAQDRVLQRQSERRALAQRSSTVPHKQLHPLLQRVAAPPARAWSQISGREGTQPLFRVGQVDAELLDEELLGLFGAQIKEALKYYGSHLHDNWSHEIQLVLRAVLFKLSVWDHNASYGAALQGLRYVDARSRGPVFSGPTRWQKALCGLLTVGGRYAWDKWEARLLDQESSFDEPSPRAQLLTKITQSLATTHTAASFLSFLVFLINGRYRTLTDRILRMRLSPPSTQVSREVSFEYLNRQLVWHAFTEFLLFLLPLVGISRWRRWLSRAWRRAMATLRRSATGDDDDDASGGRGGKHQGELAHLPERTCPICYRQQNPATQTEADLMAASSSAAGGLTGSAQMDIVNPYEALPCGCIYCFVCIAQALEGADGDGWTCLRCGELVRQCQPWNGDVLVESSTQARASPQSQREPEPGPEPQLDAPLESQLESVDIVPVRKSVEFVDKDELIDSSSVSSEDHEGHSSAKEDTDDNDNPWTAGDDDEDDGEEDGSSGSDQEGPSRQRPYAPEEEDDDDDDEGVVMFSGR